MGNLGFLYELNSEEHIVVFFEKNKFKGNVIIGFSPSLKLQNTRFYFLSKELKLNEFLTFDKSNFLYSKISLNDKKIIDFKHLTCWLTVKNYQKFYSKLRFEEFSTDIEKELIKRTIELYDLI